MTLVGTISEIPRGFAAALQWLQLLLQFNYSRLQAHENASYSGNEYAAEFVVECTISGTERSEDLVLDGHFEVVFARFFCHSVSG